jgi:hypothetical protein
MGKQYRRPYWSTTCEKHGRIMDEKSKIAEVRVAQPKSKREVHAGCPACRRKTNQVL